MIRFLPVMLIILLTACGSSKVQPGMKTPDVPTENGTFIISAELIEKQFELKNSKISDYEEWYVRRSVQDYFIKFCESKVTREELEKALSKHKGSIKTLTLEVEFKEGFWDSCTDELVQSRTGEYVVIHRVVE